MTDPSIRDDLSRFLVHLTRDYEAASAEENLIAILRTKILEARNAHCLFKYDLKRLELSDTLQGEFKTLCFTETPLTQIHALTKRIPGRSIRLRPYGLVFHKSFLVSKGANPAIYIHQDGSELKAFILREFRKRFGKIKTLKGLRNQEERYYRSIVQYYSLINIVADHHNFAWEREWRLPGSLNFKYSDIVVIVAKNPDDFEMNCSKILPSKKFQYIKRLPIIAPNWSYDDIVEEMSVKVWNYALAQQSTSK